MKKQIEELIEDKQDYLVKLVWSEGKVTSATVINTLTHPPLDRDLDTDILFDSYDEACDLANKISAQIKKVRGL